MIVFFTTGRHRYALKGVTKSRYRNAKIHVRSYDWLFRQTTVRAATCIFTDFDRLSHYELVKAAEMFRQIRDAGIQVLNDPARVCHREELLFRLHKAGINRFRAYRAVTDPAPERFPVFLKCVSNHAQEFDELIANQADLEKRLEQLRATGFPLTHMLVIEFANRLHRDNIYRRHTIFRVGETMVPGNPVTEASPFAKYGDIKLASEEDIARSIDEIMQNPHAGLMKKVFEIAGIEYGRADFGFDGDAPAVYEINTNPAMGLQVRGAEGAYREAIGHWMRLVTEAVNGLDGKDSEASLVHSKPYFSRLDFSYSPRLKQP